MIDLIAKVTVIFPEGHVLSLISTFLLFILFTLLLSVIENHRKKTFGKCGFASDASHFAKHI